MVLITHDPHHVHPVGDRIPVLGPGRSLDDPAKGEVSVEELTRLMAGGAEPAERTSALERPSSEKGSG